MLEELYDNFHKFSKSEVLHFHKLEQQRKVLKENEASRPTKYNRGTPWALTKQPSKFTSLTPMDAPPPENWKKKFDPPQLENRNRVFDTIKEYHQLSGGYTSRGRGHGWSQDRPLYCIYNERDKDHKTKDCPIFLESKKKMAQKWNQPSNPPPTKEVNHTTH
jgi:hypothetical protein